jgi:flagellin
MPYLFKEECFMIINHNLSAINAQRQMYKTSTAQAKATEKLSSGLRINRAGDDAAGLAISEKMRGQISGLNQASRNAQDAISLIQTAEGALDETHSMLQRMRELAVQAENGTNTDDDKHEIQNEIQQLQEEITAITTKTEFNTKKLLNGDLKFKTKGTSASTLHTSASKILSKASGLAKSISALMSKGSKTSIISKKRASVASQVKIAVSKDRQAESIANKNQNGGLTFQVGANGMQTIKVGINSLTAKDLRIDKIDVTKATTNKDAMSDINKIDRALNTVSSQRSKLGAVQNRLEHTIASVDNAAENLQSAESRIRDTDMAKEMMTLTAKNVLSQATQAMLAQANQKPNQVLTLLQ